MNVRPATAKDVIPIRALLDSCGLPSEDIEDHVEHFVVALDGDLLAGVVGLEVRKAGGLLRSLAVDPAHRGTGLGIRLTDEILSYAESRSIPEVGLLTTTADRFFSKLGFQIVPRERIPAFITESNEYKVYCPSNGVCMVKRLY